jgi:hypothetical protein
MQTKVQFLFISEVDSSVDIVYQIISNPETYIQLSPNIVYISFKDETKTIMHSKVHVDLTFLKKRWLFWELAETVDGIFSWESTQYEITLKISDKTGSDITITYHIGFLHLLSPSFRSLSLENHPLGTQVVSKVIFSNSKSIRRIWNKFTFYGPCAKLIGNSLQKEQSQLLLNLRGLSHSSVSLSVAPHSQHIVDHVQDKSVMDMYRDQINREILFS